MPFWISPPGLLTISSRKRLAWRALRETSDMPFLLLSSSSRVEMGRKISCSSKRNMLVGSCIRTLVSSTNSLVRVLVAVRFFRVGTVWASVVADDVSAVVRASDGFNKIKYLLGMTWNFDPAPFPEDDAVP